MRLFRIVTAAIAAGKRPDPSRTRKLSQPAPMVLHPPGCGRVGHRRTPPKTPEAPNTVGGLRHTHTRTVHPAKRRTHLPAPCGFHRIVHLTCPLPVGSSDLVTRYKHLTLPAHSGNNPAPAQP